MRKLASNLSFILLSRVSGLQFLLNASQQNTGEVYDVTKQYNWFGPGGPYCMHTGKDASRAWAQGSSNVSDCTDDLSGLSKQENETLGHWLTYFKYV